MMRSTNLLFVVASGLLVLTIVAASSDQSQRQGLTPGLEMLSESGVESASLNDEPDEATPRTKKSFRVHIRRPAGPPLVELAAVDLEGRVGRVACSTCHSVRKPNFDNKYSASLDEFHQGLQVDHGKLACYACHHPDDANSLRSADGTKISYQNVMTLCSQCHGPQATAFAHGAHGGMTGFWDLSRGPQMKNNCIDCHDPHAPRYPKMIVGFKPRDRFLDEARHDDH